MKNRFFFLILMAFVSLISACSTTRPASGGGYTGSFSQSGMASYYADKFEGRKTASGEVYEHSLKTAAHKSLPFGAMLRVRNVQNGKSVVVKVNDRGAMKPGRVIDLSKSAFESIGNPAAGLIQVELQAVR